MSNADCSVRQHLVNADTAQESHRASGPRRERPRAGPSDVANDRYPCAPRRPVLERGEQLLRAHRHLALGDCTGLRGVHKIRVYRQLAHRCILSILHAFANDPLVPQSGDVVGGKP